MLFSVYWTQQFADLFWCAIFQPCNCEFLCLISTRLLLQNYWETRLKSRRNFVMCWFTLITTCKITFYSSSESDSKSIVYSSSVSVFTWMFWREESSSEDTSGHRARLREFNWVQCDAIHAIPSSLCKVLIPCEVNMYYVIFGQWSTCNSVRLLQQFAINIIVVSSTCWIMSFTTITHHMYLLQCTKIQIS
jgi:hypothetical protein